MNDFLDTDSLKTVANIPTVWMIHTESTLACTKSINDPPNEVNPIIVLRSCDAVLYYNLNASINSSGAHPPGNRGTFAHIVSPRGGALANSIAAWGLGISIPWGDPRHLTHVFSKDGWVYWEGGGLCQWLACPSGTRKTCRYVCMCSQF